MHTVGFHIHALLRVVKIIETESRMVVARGWGRRAVRNCLMGKSFSFTRYKEFWRWLVVMVAQQCECT